jgi:hypothetical protein
MTSQQCPAWFAVFSSATRQEHTSQELIDFMHSCVNDKSPVIGRMLKGYEAYVALTGHDLHDKSLKGVNAFRVKGVAETRSTFPFNEHKAKLFAEMYEGAAMLHSKKTFVKACINESTSCITSHFKRGEYSIHTLANYPDFKVFAGLYEQGVDFCIHHDHTPHLKTIKMSSQPMAFVVKEKVQFHLPKDFEASGGLKLSWKELEQYFGISKDLYDVHSVMTGDPVLILQGAYKAVHSQEVHEIYHMDFSESD